MHLQRCCTPGQAPYLGFGQLLSDADLAVLRLRLRLVLSHVHLWLLSEVSESWAPTTQYGICKQALICLQVEAVPDM